MLLLFDATNIIWERASPVNKPPLTISFFFPVSFFCREGLVIIYMVFEKAVFIL